MGVDETLKDARQHFEKLADRAVDAFVEKMEVSGLESAGVESVRRVFRGRYLPAKYVYKVFPHELFTMVRHQPGLIGHLLTEKDLRQTLVRSVKTSKNTNIEQSNVSHDLELLNVVKNLRDNFSDIAHTMLTEIDKCVHCQDTKNDLKKFVESLSDSHWILVPINRRSGTKTLLQPLAFLYVFGDSGTKSKTLDAMARVLTENITSPARTTTDAAERAKWCRTRLLLPYLRTIARLVRSTTIPANMLFADKQVYGSLSSNRTLDQTPLMIESVAYMCFGMQLALTCNAMPRVAKVVCCNRYMMDSTAPEPRTVEVPSDSVLTKVKGVVVKDLTSLGNYLVAELTLNISIPMKQGGKTLLEAVRVLKGLEDARVPPVVMCCKDQAAIDLLVLASPQFATARTPVKELWCVSVKVLVPGDGADSLAHALAYDWLRVALQAQRELRVGREQKKPNETLASSVSAVRFVAVSAAAIEQSLDDTIVATVFPNMEEGRGQQKKRSGVQENICSTICDAWKAKYKTQQPQTKEELMDFLHELRTVCPISTALSGDGLDVLMPAGISVLVPTVTVRGTPEVPVRTNNDNKAKNDE